MARPQAAASRLVSMPGAPKPRKFSAILPNTGKSVEMSLDAADTSVRATRPFCALSE